MAGADPRATIGSVTDYSASEAAQRAGVDEDFVSRIRGLGVLPPRPDDRLTQADVRRVQLSHMLETAGVPLDGVGALIRSGVVSMDFLETPTYERFSTLSTETFEGMAARTGVPLELLMVVREATGSAVPQPTDFLREDELEIAAFLEVQVKMGFRPPAIERLPARHRRQPAAHRGPGGGLVDGRGDAASHGAGHEHVRGCE